MSRPLKNQDKSKTKKITAVMTKAGALEPTIHCATDFIDQRRGMGLSICTLNHYVVSLKRLADFLTAKQLKFVGLKSRNMTSFFNWLQDEGLQSKTIQGIGIDLQQFFRWCLKEKEIACDPLEDVTIPKAAKKILPDLPMDQFNKLIKACSGNSFPNVRNRALLWLLLDTGLRLEEMAELNLCNLRMDQGDVHVIQGKGDKDRFTPFDSTARIALSKYLRMLQNPDPNGPLWYGQVNSLSGKRERLSYNGISQTIKRLKKRTGVTVSPHQLRRTCGITMLRNGAPLNVVSKHLGHARIECTMPYLNVVESDVKEFHRKYSAANSFAG